MPNTYRKLPSFLRVGQYIGPVTFAAAVLDKFFLRTGVIMWVALGALVGWFVWADVSKGQLKR